MRVPRLMAAAILLVVLALLAVWVKQAPRVITIHCVATEANPQACSGRSPVKPLGDTQPTPSLPGANSASTVPTRREA